MFCFEQLVSAGAEFGKDSVVLYWGFVARLYEILGYYVSAGK